MAAGAAAAAHRADTEALATAAALEAARWVAACLEEKAGEAEAADSAEGRSPPLPPPCTESDESTAAPDTARATNPH